jgi:hypothetical protein
MTNTRMKDYFDLDVLLQGDELDPGELRRAIEATFERRKLAMPTELPVGLSDTFAADATKQIQWKAFLKKNRLDRDELTDLVARLQRQLRVTGVI